MMFLITLFLMFAGIRAAAAQPAIPDIWPGENANIIVVEPDNWPVEYGALNRAIEANGNPDGNTIYVLQNGATYWTDTEMQYDFPLYMAAAEYPSNDPPIIRPGTDLLGSSHHLDFHNDDTEFRGIYLYGVDDAGGLSRPMRSTAEASTHIIRYGFLEGSDNYLIQLNGHDQSWYILDSQMRNVGRPTSLGNSRLFETRNHRLAMLYMQNSSVYNALSLLFTARGAYAEEIYIDHVTVTNHTGGNDRGTAAWAFQNVRKLTVKNSLFIDTYLRGTLEHVDAVEEGRRYYNAGGFVSVTSYGSGLNNLTDADRSIVIRNNNFGGEAPREWQDIWEERNQGPTGAGLWATDPQWLANNPGVGSSDPAWATRDTIRVIYTHVTPLDSLLEGWVERGAAWVTYENNIEENLEFNDPPDSLVPFFRDHLAAESDLHHYDRWEITSQNEFENYFAPNPQGTPTTSLWRDLSYSPAEASFTLAEGGFPVGNLNYFPDMRAEWEAREQVSVERNGGLPSGFRLLSNYPNPFNPTTNIVFELASPSDVTFDVYNVLGQKVATLDLGPQGAGRHTVRFDAGNLASGMYIVRMQMGAQVQSLRITLMK